uniref:G_PROTEIN_RECEP_F1_2 domain-containing protein n=1 Tax=Panagrellus redivivus TaxID=6233 RepID=A0A7E4ZS01_PANRE
MMSSNHTTLSTLSNGDDETDLMEQECIHLSQAIAEQGIEDITSWTSVTVLFTIVYSALFVLGIIGNGGVLVAVAHNKRLRSARNIFLLNLILTDLLLCLTGIPVTPWYALNKEWVFGAVMCRLMPLSNSCAVFVTSWSLTAIALDKFIHITDPTREPVSIRRAGIVTLLIWLICSLINIPYLLSYELVNGSYYVAPNATPFCGEFCDETQWDTESSRRIYGSTVMLLQFVVPMSIITYCYWRILDKVHRDMIIQNEQFSRSLTSSQRVDAINRKKRVNYILIGMVLAFIGCWLPLTAVNLVKDFRQEPAFMRSQPYFWPLVAHVIAMSTVVWNPLLFFWLTRKQKSRSFGGMLHTSEIITSLASRVHSLRSTNNDSVNEARYKRRHISSSNRPSSIKTITSGSTNGSVSGPFACQHRPSVSHCTRNTPRASIASNGTTVLRPLISSPLEASNNTPDRAPRHSPSASSLASNRTNNNFTINPSSNNRYRHPIVQASCSLKDDLLNML